MYFYYFFVLIGLLTLKYGDVMELVDVPDSKSGVGNYVPVRPRPSAFTFSLLKRKSKQKEKKT